MRRWLAMLAGVAAIAVTGTALALTGAEEVDDAEIVSRATPEVKTTEKVDTTTTIAEEKESEPTSVDSIETDELAWEAPERLEPPDDPIDDVPPLIVILHPQDGQVFERSEVVFEGTSEPGALVFARELQFEVGEDGSWRIVLHLSPGENEITVTAKDSSGNHATDSVIVIYRQPEEPKAEEPKEQPKEEPKGQPKEEPKEQAKDEPTDHEVTEWEFSAHQLYGECGESPPYDVFHGSGHPGSLILVRSEFGSGSTEVGEHGEWEIRVIFESAPVGVVFPVKVKDEFGNHQVFEFVRTG